MNYSILSRESGERNTIYIYAVVAGGTQEEFSVLQRGDIKGAMKNKASESVRSARYTRIETERARARLQIPRAKDNKSAERLQALLLLRRRCCCCKKRAS